MLRIIGGQSTELFCMLRINGGQLTGVFFYGKTAQASW